MNSVRVDDWTVELVIIASNEHVQSARYAKKIVCTREVAGMDKNHINIISIFCLHLPLVYNLSRI